MALLETSRWHFSLSYHEPRTHRDRPLPFPILQHLLCLFSDTSESPHEQSQHVQSNAEIGGQTACGELSSGSTITAPPAARWRIPSRTSSRYPVWVTSPNVSLYRGHLTCLRFANLPPPCPSALACFFVNDVLAGRRENW
jgi:hypothetical protein